MYTLLSLTPSLPSPSSLPPFWLLACSIFWTTIARCRSTSWDSISLAIQIVICTKWRLRARLRVRDQLQWDFCFYVIVTCTWLNLEMRKQMFGASSCLFFLVHFCCRNSLRGEGMCSKCMEVALQSTLYTNILSLYTNISSLCTNIDVL